MTNIAVNDLDLMLEGLNHQAQAFRELHATGISYESARAQMVNRLDWTMGKATVVIAGLEKITGLELPR